MTAIDYQDTITVRIETVNFADLVELDHVKLLPLNLDPMTEMFIERIGENGTVYFAYPVWHKEDFSGEKVQPFGEFKTSYFSIKGDYKHLNYQVTRTIKVPNYFRARAIHNQIFKDIPELNNWLARFWDR